MAAEKPSMTGPAVLGDDESEILIGLAEDVSFMITCCFASLE